MRRRNAERIRPTRSHTGNVLKVLIIVTVLIFALAGCQNLLGFASDDDGGDGEGSQTYTVTVSVDGAQEGESLTTDVSEAAEGDTVTLTASLDGGRQVALTAAGVTIDPSTISSDGGTAAFIMPAAAVEISAVFSAQEAAIKLQFDTEKGAGDTIELPLHGIQKDIEIDWGDGSDLETLPDASSMRWVSHTYEEDGEYVVAIHGSLEGYGDVSYDQQDRGRSFLTAVLDWRRVDGITSFRGGFAGATNLTDVPDYLPEGVRTTERMFSAARAFNDGDVADWDTSWVENMAWMFSGAWSFNQPIGDWDTSRVTSMRAMFFHSWGERENASFNQDLDGWDTSQVTDMYRMFMGQNEFNGAIGNWDVSKVVTMQDMFRDVGAFNQDIGSWDTGSVQNMQYMFRYTFNFNRDIGGWDVSNVTEMGGMFRQARVFNQDLSGWCVDHIDELPPDPEGSNSWWHRWGGDVLHGRDSDGNVKGDDEDKFLPQWGTCPAPQNM
jgi:surface protein